VNSEYEAFLASKLVRAQPAGFDAASFPDFMFPHQAFATQFCLRQGRAALFLSTGLGKTLIQLEFLRQSLNSENSDGAALLLTPLAVAQQIKREADKYRYVAHVVRKQADVKIGINICNYDMLEHLDANAFSAVSLDESSVLKNFAGKTTRALIETFKDTPYRLCATATPAPNDHMELGTHAEFLGIMNQHEMLTRWFINDTSTASSQWRLKGHARGPFWDWVSSWAVLMQSPSDYGFDGSAFILPPLNIIEHEIVVPLPQVSRGGFFSFSDVSAIKMHEVKRQTAYARARKVSDIIDTLPDESWLVWCDTDYEADAIKAAVDIVDIRGSTPRERKEARIEEFCSGKIKRLLTKPSIAGMGLNLQHCANTIYAGRTFSYEQWFQSVRRFWRFGQKRPVNVHILLGEGEEQIKRVIDRKAADHAYMTNAMIEAARRNTSKTSNRLVAYEPKHDARIPPWLA